MAYKNFSLKSVKEKFQLIEKRVNLFPIVTPVEPSEALQIALRRGRGLQLENEKIRSEALIFPVLLEMRDLYHNIFGFYSGEDLNADAAEGLNGECDFLLSAEDTIEVSAPIFTLVEAKHNVARRYYGLCVAQMVGAQIFNQKNESTIPFIYGAVSSGEEWQFIKLEGKILTFDAQKYFDVKDTMGVLKHILDEYRSLGILKQDFM